MSPLNSLGVIFHIAFANHRPARCSKWNTTLKAIIPLPEKGDPMTYLDYEFSPGTYVLACYPETTSFYRAIIQSGPHPVSVGTGKVCSVSLCSRFRQH